MSTLIMGCHGLTWDVNPSASTPASILSWEPGHPSTKGVLKSQSRFVFPDLGECSFLVGSGTHGCAHILCGNFSFPTKGQELLLKLSHPITFSRKHSAAPGLGPAQAPSQPAKPSGRCVPPESHPVGTSGLLWVRGGGTHLQGTGLGVI